uniref:SLC13/DASS family transporter n=1 Tax=Fervidobacterium pennivorans TaxID=93466 RepID=A0A832IJY2_FERPE
MVKPVKKENEKCYKCNRIEWIAYTTPRKIHEFIYSRRNLLAVVIISFVTYFASVGQTEIIRRTLAAFVFTAGCWILEVFPLPITGLMIPLLLTLLGVFEPKEAFAPFSNQIIFLMIGGLVLGQSVKKHGLDKLIAYNMLVYSRGSIDRLVLLAMIITGFLSMWMANTVAIAVILPVVLSILNAIPKELSNVRIKMLLAVSISASIGGMAMLTGSTPAMIAAAFLVQRRPFSFIDWAYYSLPVSLLSLTVAFLILKQVYPSTKIKLNIDSVIEQKKQFEHLTAQQKKVILIFSATIFLWFMGSQIEVWLGLPASISSAAIVSILAVLAMFGFNLLDLRDLQTIQWELIFLVGGGILLGEAMIASGTAGKISSLIASLHGLSTPIIILLLSVISLALTNFISNSATAAIMIPITIETSAILGFNLVPFVVAVALSATAAFITPIGAPSTALVYATGEVPKRKLIKTGALIAIPVLTIIILITLVLPTL